MSKHLNISIAAMGQAARLVSRELGTLTTQKKNAALISIAKQLRENIDIILAANAKDLACAEQKQLSPAMLDRLRLTRSRLDSLAESLKAMAELQDPVGRILAQYNRPNGLKITRISIPIGVIAVIYESRPNVTVDAAALCLKAGNAVILRGGSESFYSSQALLSAIHAGLAAVNLPLSAIQMVPTKDREAVNQLLKLTADIDVIIPRGGPKLIEFISQHTQIPLFKHLAGICHTYVHTSAHLDMANRIILNAKMRRTGICGATESLLIDKAIAQSHLPRILSTLITAGCEIRGDAQVVALDARVHLATAADFSTEFLEAKIAVKIVDDISQAIAHIAAHGTQHTESIIAEDQQAAEKFLREVDSAIVMHNASTQFADGGEFGMGAEIGIATGKLHARGPVGLEQLTTFKYIVHGQGQIRGE